MYIVSDIRILLVRPWGLAILERSLGHVTGVSSPPARDMHMLVGSWGELEVVPLPPSTALPGRPRQREGPPRVARGARAAQGCRRRRDALDRVIHPPPAHRVESRLLRWQVAAAAASEVL